VRRIVFRSKDYGSPWKQGRRPEPKSYRSSTGEGFGGVRVKIVKQTLVSGGTGLTVVFKRRTR